MKSEKLPRAKKLESSEEESGLRRRPNGARALSSSEAYVDPKEANAFVSSRTQDLDRKLAHADSEERAAILNELGKLKRLKQKIDQEVSQEGEDILVENPYFGGETEYDSSRMTHESAARFLDRAVAEREVVLAEREQLMQKLRSLDEGSSGFKRQSGLGERLREVLDELDSVEEQVTKGEKLVTMLPIRDALRARREAIMSELRTIDEPGERALDASAQLKQSASRRAVEADLKKMRAGVVEAAALDESRRPTDEEELEIMRAGIEGLSEADEWESRATHMEQVAKATQKLANETQEPRHLRAAAEDQKAAKRMRTRAEMTRLNAATNEAIGLNESKKRKVATGDQLQAQAETIREYAEADELVRLGREEIVRGDFLRTVGERLSDEAKARKRELATELDTVMGNLEKIEQRIHALGPISQQEEPKIQPYEERVTSKSRGQSSAARGKSKAA